MLPLLVALLYALFFLSGAAALVYQVVWVRSLTLVFGGTHLAVTAVLSIFMSGLAIGGYVLGRRVGRVAQPLRLYGWLEIGVAGSALAFAALMPMYPFMYAALARGHDDATLYLAAIRLVFSTAALILPTTLMGGTLPVLAHFVSRQPQGLRTHLAFLYAVNTLGAVLGALLAGFFLLPTYSVSTTLYLAVATNALIGIVSLALDKTAGTHVVHVPVAPAGTESDSGGSIAANLRVSDPGSHVRTDRGLDRSMLVLWGIGVSGFCALGYEVLWTRILTLSIGASVYAFTIILVAFLAGIALGSEAYGLALKAFPRANYETRRAIAWFGVTQVVIGVGALLVTFYLRHIPAHAVALQNLLFGAGLPSFRARVWSNFLLAFVYMVVPALFMGAAFPMAGEIVARHRTAVGRAVGEVLSYNTVGAILGAAISGFVMIRFVGIERSLQVLTVMNVGLGLLVLASLRKPRWLPAGVGAATLAVIAFLTLHHDAARMWDTRYFAVFRSNQPEAFSTPAMIREAVENTDVLYYAEGVESIVSVIKIRGGEQSFVTSGRVEASTNLQDQQVQFTLGHLPMLLNRNPKDVLVVGLGSGMTAGATAVHPGVHEVTLVEIEPQVLGVARTFEAYNHRVLENPKVRVVLNDGRNFLMTTNRTFDVITADPIHPWFRGAGYLYTSEYFALAAAHLRPGGVVAQWLPLYELTPHDVQSIVKTFQQHFPHTLLWLTHFDAELLGSNAPFVLDEPQLQRRLLAPAVAGDMQRVMMGSGADLLSYFVMSTEEMKRFSQPGTLNTDDNLYLEFSAPFSIAAPGLTAANVEALTARRESILPYLKTPADARARTEQRERWALQLAAARVGDPALALFLAGRTGEPRFLPLLGQLAGEYSWYAPGSFLRTEYLSTLTLEPRLLQQSTYTLVNEDGATTRVVDMSAVLVPVSRTRASIMFVDNRARVVYGQLYVDDYVGREFVDRFARDVMGAVRAAYDAEAAIAHERKGALPPAAETLRRIGAVIGSKVQHGVQDRS